VWGESEVWVIEKSPNKTKDLIQKMKELLGSFNRDTVVKAFKSLRSRIQCCGSETKVSDPISDPDPACS
jgi:hypothetical protein